MKNADLYYECHITIESVFDERFLVAKEIARNHKFNDLYNLLK